MGADEITAQIAALEAQLEALRALQAASTDTARDESSSSGAVSLYPWQQEALQAWQESGRRGVVQAVTGAGKTRVGIAAIEEAIGRGQQSLVITPTTDLVKQWTNTIAELLPNARIHSEKSGHDNWDVRVCTVQLAMARAALTRRGGLIVADEVHRYGAGTFAQALKDEYHSRLGLSATYARGDYGDEVLAGYFGAVRFDLDYARAVHDELISPFQFALVSVPLSAAERERYDDLCEQLTNCRQSLINRHGLEPDTGATFLREVSALAASKEFSPKIKAARWYMACFSERKRLLANTRMKYQVIAGLAPAVQSSNGSIAFTQTRESAQLVADVLLKSGCTAAAVHSDLKGDEREERMDLLRDGSIKALSAPRILDEGVDVPDADLGIIVAANRSRRQMVQRLGRVLRKREGKVARFVVLFAEQTVEDPRSFGDLPQFYDECLPWATAVDDFDMALPDELTRLLRFLGADETAESRHQAQEIIDAATPVVPAESSVPGDEDASNAPVQTAPESRTTTPEVAQVLDGDAAQPVLDGEIVLDFSDCSDEPENTLNGGVSSDPVKDYLKQIGRFPMLSAEAEVRLAKRIEVGWYAERLLAESADDPRRELSRIVAEGDNAFETFVCANLRLVVSIAKRYSGRGLEFLDLIQHGNMGLMHAVEMFDWHYGHKFSTYATWWIKQSISRALADYSRTVRLPVHFDELLRKVEAERYAARASWAQWLFTHPQGMPELHVSRDDLGLMAQFGRPFHSAEALTEAVDDTWHPRPATLDEGADALIEKLDQKVQVAELFGILAEFHPREAQVLRMRFGFPPWGEETTLEAIGEVLGVTRERVRQIEVEAKHHICTRLDIGSVNRSLMQRDATRWLRDHGLQNRQLLRQLFPDGSVPEDLRQASRRAACHAPSESEIHEWAVSKDLQKWRDHVTYVEIYAFLARHNLLPTELPVAERQSAPTYDNSSKPFEARPTRLKPRRAAGVSSVALGEPRRAVIY